MDFNTLLNGQGQQPGGVVASPQPVAIPQDPPAMSAPQVPSGQPPQEGGFFQKLQQDPAFAQSMIMMGSRLMQGPRRGQDEIGMWGEAALAGATVYSNQKAAAYDQRQQDAEIARRAAETNSRIEGQQAVTAGVRQKTDQEAQAFPETQKKVAEEIKRLRAAGRYDEAQAKLAEFRTDPRRMAEELQLDRQLTQAKIGQANASAGASSASAEASRAHAGLYKAQTENPEKFRGNAAGGKRDQMDSLQAYYKQAYPDLDDTAIAKKVLDHSLSMRGEEMQILRELSQSLDPKIAKDAQARLAQMVQLGKEQVPAPGASAKASGKDIASRFSSDPQMKGKRLGRSTDRGSEVLDSKGNLIGYYR